MNLETQSSKKKLVSAMTTVLPAVMQVSAPSSAFRTSTSPANAFPSSKKESRDVACGASPMHSSHGVRGADADDEVRGAGE